jgi:hypothetical protein
VPSAIQSSRPGRTSLGHHAGHQVRMVVVGSGRRSGFRPIGTIDSSPALSVLGGTDGSDIQSPVEGRLKGRARELGLMIASANDRPIRSQFVTA